MSLTVTFRLRTKKKTGEGMLYCRMYFDGQQLDDYASGVKVPVALWPNIPPDHPQAEIIEMQLAKIRADHSRILLTFQVQNIPFTAQDIKSAWLNRDLPRKEYTALELLDLFIEEAKADKGPERKSHHTIRNYTYARTHFADFLAQKRQSRMSAESLPIAYADDFYQYCRGFSIRSTSAKTVIHIRAMLNYSKRKGRLTHFDWSGLKLKRDAGKRINYLSENQLLALSHLILKPHQEPARKWALLMCHTGLDYRDAMAVVDNLPRYLRSGEHGETIVYQRLKGKSGQVLPRWGECEIPVLPQTKLLLEDAAIWKRPRLRNLNTYLTQFAKDIDLPFSFSSKTCRKTGGAVLFRRYRDIYLVQKALGHKSVKMTEEHYVDIMPQYVHEVMAKG